MKISKLVIEGFRSLKNVTWCPGDLNVVIGPNGSGKSNLIRFLELITVSSKGGLGKYIQFHGGMEPLLWDGISNSIKFIMETTPLEDNRTKERDSITYELELARLGKSSSYKIKKELLANYRKVKLGYETKPFKFLEREERFAYIFQENENKLTPEEDISEEETLLSIAAGPFTGNRLITLFEQQISSWRIYHDVNVHIDSPIRRPAISRLERSIDPDGHNLISVLHTLYTENRDFKKEINKAMKAAFGDDFEELVFPPAADQQIQLRIRWKSLKREQSMGDLSDGTIRFLFLLTALASPHPASLIAIDEPENGLHPAMLPIVAEYAIEASQRSQLLITTHSPQILDAFSDITRPTTTIVQWVNGETTLKTLKDETLEYWLKEYKLGNLFKSGELEEME